MSAMLVPSWMIVTAMLQFTWGGRAPRIKNHYTVLKTIPGRKVYIPCETTGDPSPTITWERDGVPVMRFGHRFSVSTESQALRIFGLKIDDRGNYTCIAKNHFGVDMVTITLLVMIQPECKIISLTNFTFLELTNQELVCRSRGLPQPSFQWFTNRHQRIRPMKFLSDSMVSSERLYAVERQIDEEMFESILFFQPIIYKDLGNFVCVAHNEIGSSRDTVTLDVRFSPKDLTDHEVPQIVDWWEGHSASLTCLAAGNDLPEVTWFHNGQPFLCVTLEEWVHGSEITSTCKIKHRKDGGTGNYSCSAENSLGKIWIHEFYVREIFAPPSVTFTPISIRPDEVLLSVRVPLKEDTPLAAYVLASYRLISNNSDKPSPQYERMGDVNSRGEATVKLVGIIENRDYVVNIRARNIVGFGPESISVIYTAPKTAAPSPQPLAGSTACLSKVETDSKDDVNEESNNTVNDRKDDDSRVDFEDEQIVTGNGSERALKLMRVESNAGAPYRSSGSCRRCLIIMSFVVSVSFHTIYS